MLVERYRPILYLQYLLLSVDIFMNSFIELLRFENVILLVLLVIQDVCILFAAIVVFLLFFNTYIFQAGLVNILVNKFRVPITVIFIYFSLCVGLHVWYMMRVFCYILPPNNNNLFTTDTFVVSQERFHCIFTRRWTDPDAYIWNNDGLRALFIIQRTAAVFYYYFYKRTCLKLGDPRFYQDSDWIKKEFEKRR